MPVPFVFLLCQPRLNATATVRSAFGVNLRLPGGPTHADVSPHPHDAFDDPTFWYSSHADELA